MSDLNPSLGKEHIEEHSSLLQHSLENDGTIQNNNRSNLEDTRLQVLDGMYHDNQQTMIYSINDEKQDDMSEIVNLNSTRSASNKLSDFFEEIDDQLKSKTKMSSDQGVNFKRVIKFLQSKYELYTKGYEGYEFVFDLIMLIALGKVIYETSEWRENNAEEQIALNLNDDDENNKDNVDQYFKNINQASNEKKIKYNVDPFMSSESFRDMLRRIEYYESLSVVLMPLARYQQYLSNTVNTKNNKKNKHNRVDLQGKFWALIEVLASIPDADNATNRSKKRELTSTRSPRRSITQFKAEYSSLYDYVISYGKYIYMFLLADDLHLSSIIASDYRVQLLSQCLKYATLEQFELICANHLYSNLIQKNYEAILGGSSNVVKDDSKSLFSFSNNSGFDRKILEAFYPNLTKNKFHLLSIIIDFIGPGSNYSYLLLNCEKEMRNARILKKLLASSDEILTNLAFKIIAMPEVKLNLIDDIFNDTIIHQVEQMMCTALTSRLVLLFLVRFYDAVLKNGNNGNKTHREDFQEITANVGKIIAKILSPDALTQQQLKMLLLAEEIDLFRDRKLNGEKLSDDVKSKFISSSLYIQEGSIVDMCLEGNIRLILESDVIADMIENSLRDPCVETRDIYDTPLVVPIVMYVIDVSCQLIFFFFNASVCIHYGEIADFNDYSVRSDSSWTTNEIFLALLYFSSLLHELGELLSADGDALDYLQDEWNYTDLTSASLGIIWFVSRFIPGAFTIARIAVALAAIPQAIGLLRNFSLLPSMSRLVKALMYMAEDLLAFAILYIICIAGFGVAFRGLFSHSTELSTNTYTFLALFQGTMGDLNYDMFDSNNDVVTGIGIVVLIVFVIFTAIVLVNMLIALMGDSFQKGKDEIYDMKVKIAARLTLSRINTVFSMLPAPLNLLPTLLYPFDFIIQSRKKNFHADSNVFVVSVAMTVCNNMLLLGSHFVRRVNNYQADYIRNSPSRSTSNSRRAVRYLLMLVITPFYFLIFFLFNLPVLIYRTVTSKKLRFYVNHLGELKHGSIMELKKRSMLFKLNVGRKLIRPSQLGSSKHSGKVKFQSDNHDVDLNESLDQQELDKFLRKLEEAKQVGERRVFIDGHPHMLSWYDGVQGVVSACQLCAQRGKITINSDMQLSSTQPNQQQRWRLEKQPNTKKLCSICQLHLFSDKRCFVLEEPASSANNESKDLQYAHENCLQELQQQRIAKEGRYCCLKKECMRSTSISGTEFHSHFTVCRLCVAENIDYSVLDSLRRPYRGLFDINDIKTIKQSFAPANHHQTSQATMIPSAASFGNISESNRSDLALPAHRDQSLSLSRDITGGSQSWRENHSVENRHVRADTMQVEQLLQTIMQKLDAKESIVKSSSSSDSEGSLASDENENALLLKILQQQEELARDIATLKQELARNKH